MTESPGKAHAPTEDNLIRGAPFVGVADGVVASGRSLNWKDASRIEITRANAATSLHSLPIDSIHNQFRMDGWRDGGKEGWLTIINNVTYRFVGL